MRSPRRHLNDRIRKLCAQAAAAVDDAKFAEILVELQTALHERAARGHETVMRQAMRQRASRISELVAKVQIEQDPRKYSSLVQELNRLLEGDQPVRSPRPRSA